MNNNRKRPRIDPLVRLEHENAILRTRLASREIAYTVKEAELTAAEHTSDLALAHVMTNQRRLQCQLQQGVWDEV